MCYRRSSEECCLAIKEVSSVGALFALLSSEVNRADACHRYHKTKSRKMPSIPPKTYCRTSVIKLAAMLLTTAQGPTVSSFPIKPSRTNSSRLGWCRQEWLHGVVKHVLWRFQDPISSERWGLHCSSKSPAFPPGTQMLMNVQSGSGSVKVMTTMGL